MLQFLLWKPALREAEATLPIVDSIKLFGKIELLKNTEVPHPAQDIRYAKSCIDVKHSMGLGKLELLEQ